MRFLIDENLPSEIAEMLRELGHDAVTVWDIGLQRAPDVRLNEFAIREGRVIVTRDLDFPLRREPSAPGLIIFRTSRNAFKPEILELMLLASPAFEFVLRSITVVTQERIRSRPIKDA
jgi:predicted nuclease of predicted toxin-antitoxin system